MADKEHELTYVIRVKGFGDADKIHERIGKKLAKICTLAFSDVKIYGRQGSEFKWDTKMPHE